MKIKNASGINYNARNLNNSDNMIIKLLLRTFQRGLIILKEDVSLNFLEEQLEWCKEQDRILYKIETKLYEMEEIAEYAPKNNLYPF